MRKSVLIPMLMCIAVPVFSIAACAESINVAINAVSDKGVGQEIGRVTFVEVTGGLDIVVDITSVSPGEHGMHIHENPSCATAEKDGKVVPALAAGGHYDPSKAGMHAGPGKAGHKGDLPHVIANAKGEAKVKLHAPGLTVKDIKNRSVMIHAGGDNYSDTPPLGGGGARIACGVIK